MRHLSALFLVASSLVACVRSPDLDSAERSVDSSDTVEAEGNVMMAMVDGVDASAFAPLSADQAAARIAANVSARWNPSGCATATQSGATVTMQLAGCTGPRGLRSVTGQLELVVSVGLSGGVSLHATGTDLDVDGATLSIDADATYTASAGSHTLAVETHGSGIGPRGNEIERAGQYTIEWDSASQCRSLAGHWSTEVTTTRGTATRSNDVDMSRCAGSCPVGTITHHFLSDRTLEITFDGSAVATWSTSGGKSGSVELSCP